MQLVPPPVHTYTHAQIELKPYVLYGQMCCALQCSGWPSKTATGEGCRFSPTLYLVGRTTAHWWKTLVPSRQVVTSCGINCVHTQSTLVIQLPYQVILCLLLLCMQIFTCCYPSKWSLATALFSFFQVFFIFVAISLCWTLKFVLCTLFCSLLLDLISKEFACWLFLQYFFFRQESKIEFWCHFIQ